jgi:hypothetical protein
MTRTIPLSALLRRFVAGLFLALTMTTPATAADRPTPVANSTTPAFAGYWGEFLDHWTGAVQKQNGVILVALGVGAVSLLIITRGKWRK